MKGMCNCVSYNRPDLCAADGKLSVILIPPNWAQKTGICIDACIADAIKMLWDNGIVTRGCCCGHNGAFGDSGPSVVISEGEDADKTLRLLGTHDTRPWKVLQWRLCEVSAANPTWQIVPLPTPSP
jgi:hypothetical protein